MTLNQIKYVIEVANAGSINKAASNLFISQSVLSASISSLESELGDTIFNRSARGIDLTPFGQTFLDYIIPIQLQINQLNSVLSNRSRNYEQTFSLVTNGFYFTSEICAKLLKKYQDQKIRINQYESFDNRVMTLVANGTAEIGLTRQWNCYIQLYSKQQAAMNLQFFPIATLSIGVTVGPGNPLFRHPENVIQPELLEPYPIILYDYMDQGPFSDILERLHIPANASRMVTSSRAANYEVLANTDAYFLNSDYNIPRSKCAQQTYPYPHRTLLLRDCPIHSEIGWIKRADTPLSPIAQETINLLYEYFQS